MATRFWRSFVSEHLPRRTPGSGSCALSPRIACLAVALVLAASAAGTAVAAQGATATAVTGNKTAAAPSYPERSLRFVVPYPPGGSNDILSRLLAQRLTERFARPVLIDNRPGAGGVLGSEIAARAAPDGHTLLQAANGPIAVAPSAHPKLPYNPARDFAPVAMFATIPYVIGVTPSLPATSLRQLIDYARSRPGQLRYASSGNASTPHLCGELLNVVEKLDIVHVPYKGGAQAVLDLMSGQVHFYCAGVPTLLGQIKAGRIRPLVMTMPARSPLLPEVPTARESGVPALAGFEVSGWMGVLVPARSPTAAISALEAAILGLLETPELRREFIEQGADTMPMNRGAFAAYLQSETARWAKVVKTAKIAID
jgi:tripartite-type tricarboxylate transporter receptor subunit TctC